MMDEIRAEDRKLFIRELFGPKRLGQLILTTALTFTFGYMVTGHHSPFPILSLPIFLFGSIIFGARKDSIQKRFKLPRFKALWDGCTERMERFEKVLVKAKNTNVADLQEMPQTVRAVSDALYLALRRSDMVYSDIHETEGEMLRKPPAWKADTQDAQSQALYSVAEKNIVEYKQRYDAVVAGVHRCEAQCAVFMTTLDTLRMRILTYKVAGKSPELASHQFLYALSEAKLQLSAIDQALDELELGPYPTSIAVMPNKAAVQPPTEDVEVRE